MARPGDQELPDVVAGSHPYRVGPPIRWWQARRLPPYECGVLGGAVLGRTATSSRLRRSMGIRA